MKSVSIVVGIAATSVLVACGETVPTTPVTPLNLSSGDTVDVTYNSATDALEVSVNGGSVVSYPHDVTKDLPGFTAFDDATNSVIIHVGESSSGGTHATIFATTENTAAPQILGVAYGRNTNSNIPTAGGGTYAGNYAGILRFSDGATPLSIDGSVNLTADFDAADVVGSISGREAFNTDDGSLNGVTFEDITLNGLIGSDGLLSGFINDGALTAPPGATASGSFSGVFGGINGSEIAAIVDIDHDDGTDTPNEVGVFLAE